MEQIEVWMPVVGYEGLYDVSDMGRIRSLLNGSLIMKNQKNTKGYACIWLCKNKIKNRDSLHRIVAKAFLMNIENKPCVNHIDGNKLNNKISNLEWCTHKENIRHAVDTGLLKPTLKPTYLFDGEGVLLKKFGSVNEVAIFLNLSQAAISGSISRGTKVSGYRVSHDKVIKFKNYCYRKPVALVNERGDIIHHFSCAREAASKLGLKNPSFINKVCKGQYSQYKGLLFKYANIPSLIDAGIAVDRKLIEFKH